MKYKMKSYKCYLVLLISIISILLIFNYIYSNKTIYVDIFGKRLKSNEEILIKKEDEYYLSFDFIKENIDNEIYFDAISKKIVISVEDNLIKAKINEKNITKNFNEQEINNVGVIENEIVYISLEILKIAYDLNINIDNNTIYIFNNNNFECKAKTNKISVYLENNIKSKIVDYVYKKDKIIGIHETDEFVFVKINDEKFGYISKKFLSYYLENSEIEENEKENKVYIFADNNIKTIDENLKVDGIIMNMFDVTKQDCSISVRTLNGNIINKMKQDKINVYGIVTNGYNLAGFTTSTITQILSDETKRMIMINNLVEKIKEYNLNGIVIDFRMIKEKDINNYIQFIKELEAFCDKDVVVNIDANEYKNYINIINYSDFAILNIYGLRDLNSTVSGSVSDITWMEEVIDETLKVSNPEKLVVGIPAYSILWTEKNSNVIDADIYNLKAIQEYISKNNLEKKYSESVKQNYVELKKGSLVYKMWVEDETSIKNRVQLVKDNTLLGIAIYKLGYENDIIISLVNSIK